METFFYVVGGALVLLAARDLGVHRHAQRQLPDSRGCSRSASLVVPARRRRHRLSAPSQLSEDEQEHRLEEDEAEADVGRGAGRRPREAPAAPAAGTRGRGERRRRRATERPAPTAGRRRSDGQQVFARQGCGSCHTLAELGAEALGDVGPNLDEALADKDADLHRDLDRRSERRGRGGLRRRDHAERLRRPRSRPSDLDALVAYLRREPPAPSPVGRRQRAPPRGRRAATLERR